MKSKIASLRVNNNCHSVHDVNLKTKGRNPTDVNRCNVVSIQQGRRDAVEKCKLDNELIQFAIDRFVIGDNTIPTVTDHFEFVFKRVLYN